MMALGRRLFGQRPLSKTLQRMAARKRVRRTTPKPELFSKDPPVTCIDTTMRMVLRGLDQTPARRISSSLHEQRLVMKYKGNTLVSSAKSDWVAGFRCEQFLFHDLERRKKMWNDRRQLFKPIHPKVPDDVRSKLLISGEALRVNPSGVSFLYGTKESIDELVAASKLSAKSHAFALKLSDLSGLTDRESVEAKLREIAQAKFPEAVFPYHRSGEGVYRWLSVLRAIDWASMKDSYAYVLLEYTGKSREPFSVTLPGGKRTHLETAHKAAQRLLSEETGLEISFPHDTPAVAHAGNDKMLVFCRGLDQDLQLNPEFTVDYAQRFSDEVFLQGDTRHKTA